MRAGRRAASCVRPCRRIRVGGLLLDGLCFLFRFFNGATYRENALIIHYTRNDHLLRDGELVLIDAGGEYKYAVSHYNYNCRTIYI